MGQRSDEGQHELGLVWKPKIGHYFDSAWQPSAVKEVETSAGPLVPKLRERWLKPARQHAVASFAPIDTEQPEPVVFELVAVFDSVDSADADADAAAAAEEVTAGNWTAAACHLLPLPLEDMSLYPVSFAASATCVAVG